jgi:hypothetical protein
MELIMGILLPDATRSQLGTDWKDSLRQLERFGFSGLQHEKTVVSSVTTSWGVDWDEELVARDLMQNFFDANRDQVSEIKVTTAEGTVTVSAPSQYDLERLYFLGSEKGAEDVGQYGEGFKAAATCVLRSGGTFLAAASGRKVLRIRVDSRPAGGTQLYPLVYDYFTSAEEIPGNRLIIDGVAPELGRTVEGGLTNFFYEGNPLIGREELADYGRSFVVYRSRTSDGHIFYRNLKRGEIPGIPLVLVLNKKYDRIEKKIQSDRDRKAFGEEMRNVFYSLWAQYFFTGDPARQRVVVEAARPCWERGDGHPLLAEIARRKRWAAMSFAPCWQKVFGDRYFSRSTAKNPAESLRYQTVERQWEKEGRRALPGYFTAFGVPSAASYLAEQEERAQQEAAQNGQHAPSPAEQSGIALLGEVVRGLAPEMMSVFEKGRTSYTVAKTEALLGQLKKGRAYRSREVFLAEAVFESDFAQALAAFLHEHAHIFGYDGSRGFTDALTELLENVVRFRDSLGVQESKWETIRSAVAQERRARGQAREIPAGELLEAMNESQLRHLLQQLPPTALNHLLQRFPHESQVHCGRAANNASVNREV